MTVGAQAFRRLWQGDEQGGFGGGESVGRMTKPRKRCSGNTFQRAAKGGEAKVNVEHAAAPKQQAELQCAHRLVQFGAEDARLGFKQARGLHVQGGCAGDDLPMAQGLPRCAHGGERVDA